MIVVDAGAVLELVMWRGYGEPVADVLEHHADDVLAPELLDLEVAHALRRMAWTEALSAKRLAAAAAVLPELPIERVGHRPLLARVWDLRHVCSAYDAAYVALAECFGADGRLLTTDRRLARTVEALGTVSVSVVPVG